MLSIWRIEHHVTPIQSKDTAIGYGDVRLTAVMCIYAVKADAGKLTQLFRTIVGSHSLLSAVIFAYSLI